MKRDPIIDALPVLKVTGLRKSFTMHLRDGLELPILDDVSFEIRAGECIALVGPSGRGKSTLIKCLYGSYGADHGQIIFGHGTDEIDVAHASPQEVLALRRQAVAYVSQFLRVVPRVSALDVIAQRRLAANDAPGDVLADDEYDRRLEAAREVARRLFTRLNLPAALWSLPPATFSGGEQQRVNVARGFVLPAQLLLLDEPTASLDAANRDIVIELIEEAKAQGTAVVGIFHDKAVRDAVASRELMFQ